MIQVFVLLIGCTLIAYIYNFGIVTETTVGSDGRLTEQRKITGVAKLAFGALIIVMVCFAGLRTQMNDTVVYMISYETKVSDNIFDINKIDWTIGANPLFNIYMIVLKSFISKSPYVYVFITSGLIVGSHLCFFRKYSENFGLSIFFYISFTAYNFTMGAVKQSMAMAIAIWAIPLFLKRKRVTAFLLIAASIFIHPYVFVFFAIFFLYKNIWDRKTVVIIVGTIFVGIFFTMFVDQVLGILSSIGDNYDASWFEESGVNILRLPFYYITPILSFVFRKELRERKSRFINICVNLALISASFMTMASFGGANMFGRMANYFDVITCVTFPLIITSCLKPRRRRIIFTFFAVVCFLYFFYTAMSKYSGLTTDQLLGDIYNHISLGDLIASW